MDGRELKDGRGERWCRSKSPRRDKFLVIPGGGNEAMRHLSIILDIHQAAISTLVPSKLLSNTIATSDQC